MKKIMFNDKFGLTEDVLLGRKTMTRRVIENCHLAHPRFAFDNAQRCVLYEGDKKVAVSKYRIGEEVAVAQSYEQIFLSFSEPRMSHDFGMRVASVHHSGDLHNIAGWTNKMFVKATLMPHRIRITGIKVERLQGISYDDCRREGIIPVTWRQWHKQDWDDLSPQRYTDHDVWTLEKFRESLEDPWAESLPGEYMATTPEAAFAVLVFKMMGKKVWLSNPWVFAYTFELIQ